MDYINLNKIIGAYIIKPNKNEGEPWDTSSTHGWQVSLVVGFYKGNESRVLIDKQS